MDNNMSLPWFRLYRELKDDPKIGCLTDAEFRVFIEAMCWACEASNGGSTGLNLDNANWAFRRDVLPPIQSLLQKGLLCENDQKEIMVKSWAKRQVISDSSSERVKKHREKCNETLQDRYSNGADKNRVEENRQEKNIEQEAFEAFWKAYPRKIAKSIALKAFLKVLGSNVRVETLLAAIARQRQSPQWCRDNGQFIPHPATWLNQERWNDVVEKPAPTSCIQGGMVPRHDGGNY